VDAEREVPAEAVHAVERSGDRAAAVGPAANGTGARKHAARIARVSGAESDTTVLLHKLFQWLVQQPEWVRILAAPRAERKQATTLMADLMFRIPKVMPGEDFVSRATIRKVAHLMERGGEK
jgi:hypothetical protein